MPAPLKMLYTVGHVIVARGIGILGWASECCICRKPFNRKIGGVRSPCHSCNEHLLEVEQSLTALELASRTSSQIRTRRTYDATEVDAPRVSAHLLYYEV